MQINTLCEHLKQTFGDKIENISEFRGEYTLVVTKEALHDVCSHLKAPEGFDYLIDIASIDHYSEEPRFEMVYELYHLGEGIHLRLKCKLSEDNAEITTISDLWPTANWHEREVWDMMGIRFQKHPDLRRILMWEGYPYFPLRKDFPLEGKTSDVPEVAFTNPAPLDGGPFVTVPTDGTTQVREPRARHAENPPVKEKFIAEP